MDGVILSLLSDYYNIEKEKGRIKLDRCISIFEQLVNFNILNREYWVFPNGTEGEKYLPGNSVEEFKIGINYLAVELTR
jgi:hypothetical protein